jgi:hypothetical protein
MEAIFSLDYMALQPSTSKSNYKLKVFENKVASMIFELKDNANNKISHLYSR